MKTILLLCLALFVFASEAPVKLDISKGIIQLGAFKDVKNIKKLQKRFANYNIYVKSFESGLKKAYIININKDEESSYLKFVKESIPLAFVLSEDTKLKVFKNLAPCKVNISQQPKKVKESEITQQKEIIFKDTSCLDSKAIIKTRKKFFQ